MGTYRERVEALEPNERYNDSYCLGYRSGVGDSAEIAAEADARIAELEAECARLQAALNGIAYGPQGDCGHCPSCRARAALAALAAPDAGAQGGAK